MRIFPFHALLPDSSIIASPASFASDVKMHFRNYLETGHFNKRKKATFYAYQIKAKNYRFHGLLATLDVNEIIDGHVLPHENTLHHKEQTSMQLILEREAIIKPLLLTHQPKKEIQEIILNTTKARRPIQSFHYSNTAERHSIWPIVDEDAENRLTTIYANKIKQVYIADGHHRVSVIKRLHKDKRNKSTISYDRISSAFFDFDNLKILDYNRLVEYADSMSALELMALLSQSANITPLKKAMKPTKKFEITFYLDGMWFLMEWKKKILKNYKSTVLLDATILNDELLNKILGIKQVESDQHIKYITGNLSLPEIESRVDRQYGSAAFCVYPVRMDELCHQADQGRTLPPKSTFFKPRLPNGFVSLSLLND